MHPKIDSEKTPTPITKNKKSTSLKPKPAGKRKVKPRFGDDGQPEAVTAVMDHAPVHPVYVFTNGLFRPIQNGSRQSGTHVDGKYISGKSLMATSNPPTYGQSNSPRQDGQIINFLV